MIIGASGLLGSRLMALGKEKYHMFGTYNTHSVDGNDVFKLDVNKRNDVFKLVEDIKPDFVVDTHALHNVDYCETHPEETWMVNVDGTRNVAEISKRVGAKYAYISTDYVFDGKKLVYTEKDKPNPLSYYAKTKWAAEMILEALDVNYVAARTAVMYGLSGKGKLPFVLWLIGKLQANETVKIVTDQHNNPTFADNLVNILFRLFELDEKGLFHATGKDCLSRYEFSKIVARKFDLNEDLIEPITTPELNQIAKRPEKVNMNNNKVERVTGIKTLTVNDGLNILKEQLVD